MENYLTSGATRQRGALHGRRTLAVECPWYSCNRETIGAAIVQKGETMRAVGLFPHGGPEVLQVVELPEVHAGPGQVRIRVHAATVNPTDIMARNGARAEQQKADPPPYVPGMEVAGIVDEVGRDDHSQSRWRLSVEGGSAPFY
jgi:Alcohol dehydrogenase GroES-like domain